MLALAREGKIIDALNCFFVKRKEREKRTIIPRLDKRDMIPRLLF